MGKKSVFLVLLILLIPVFVVSAQTGELTLEELTQKVTDLENRVAQLEMMLLNTQGKELGLMTADAYQIHGIGDVVEGVDRTMTLNSASLKDGVLDVSFTVTNTSNGKIEVGGYYGFSAKNDDGVLLETDYYTCNSSSLDVSLIPGDKVKGSVCFTYADPSPIKIYYEPDYLSDTIYIWSISQ